MIWLYSHFFSKFPVSFTQGFSWFPHEIHQSMETWVTQDSDLFVNNLPLPFLNREDKSNTITMEFHVSYCPMTLSLLLGRFEPSLLLYRPWMWWKKTLFCFPEHLFLGLVHSDYVLWQCYYNIINHNNNSNSSTIMTFLCSQGPYSLCTWICQSWQKCLPGLQHSSKTQERNSAILWWKTPWNKGHFY